MGSAAQNKHISMVMFNFNHKKTKVNLALLARLIVRGMDGIISQEVMEEGMRGWEKVELEVEDGKR